MVLRNNLFFFFIFLFLTPVFAGVEFVESNNIEWQLESKEYIGELTEVSTDKDSITIKIKDKYKPDKDEAEQEKFYEKLEKKEGKSLLKFKEDYKNIKKYPIVLEIYNSVPNEWEECNEKGECEYIPKGEEPFVWELERKVNLGTIDITKETKVTNIANTYLRPRQKGILKIGFGTIVFNGGYIANTNTFYMKSTDAFGRNKTNGCWSFKNITDHFAANPIGSLNSTFDEGGLDWDWYAGAYAQMTGTRGTAETYFTVDDNSDFNGGNDLHPFDIGNVNYANCTKGVNEFTGCTFHTYFGTQAIALASSYDSGSDSNYFPTYDRVGQFNESNIGRDYTDKVDGEYSLVVNSSWDRMVILANLKEQPSTYSCSFAEEMVFNVKVNDTGITLNTSEIRVQYSANGRLGFYGDIWEFWNKTIPKDEWVEFRIDIRNWEGGSGTLPITLGNPTQTGYSARRDTRQWMWAIANFVMTFENATGKQIKIDSPMCYIEDANPREITPKFYEFPIPMYNSARQDGQFCFSDYGSTVLFNWLGGTWYFRDTANYYALWELGRPSDGVNSIQGSGLNIVWNTWDDGYISIYIDGGNLGLTNTIVQAYGFKLSSTQTGGILDGMGFRCYDLNKTASFMEDVSLEGVGDLHGITNFGDVKNTIVKGTRYVPVGGTNKEVDGLRLSHANGYWWADSGDFWKVYITDYRPGTTVGYGRDYASTKNLTTRFINSRFKEGYFEPATDGNWVTRSDYTTNCLILQYANTVKVKVKDTDGNDLSNITVTLSNKDGVTLWINETDTAGETEDNIVIWREYFGGCNGADDGNHFLGDSSVYENMFPFTVTATDGTDTVTWIENFNRTDSNEGHNLELVLAEDGGEMKMGIIIGLALLAGLLTYIGFNIEDEELKKLFFLFSLLFIIGDVAVMAFESTVSQTSAVLFGLLILVVVMLGFVLFIYLIRILVGLINNLLDK